MPKIKDNNPSIFAETLIALRKSWQLTQVELAEKLGLSRATIAYFEASARNPKIDTIYKLADFFGVSPEIFVIKKEAKEIKPGPQSKLEQQMHRIKKLSPAKQRTISDMIEAFLNAK